MTIPYSGLIIAARSLTVYFTFSLSVTRARCLSLYSSLSKCVLVCLCVCLGPASCKSRGLLTEQHRR